MMGLFGSLLWVSLYAALCCFGADGLFSAILLRIAYWTVLFWYLYRRGRLSAYGFCLPRFAEMRLSCALLVIPAVQTALFGLAGVSGAAALLSLLDALAEETAFRALLPGLLCERTKLSAGRVALLTCLAFSLFHGVNLLSGAAPSAVLLQMLYAFCAGYAFCATVLQTKSLLPAVILHAAINLTSGQQISPLLTLAFSALLAVYGIAVFSNTKKGSAYL